jgi:collagen triple helix repeat protein
MFRLVRRHLSYANIIATFALLFAMTGGAYAATHYLINSTRQINPRVLRALQHSGSTGTNGTQGPAGPIGAPGKEGAAGKAGSTGPAGPAGGTGPAGPEGPAGKEGPAGPSSVVHWHVNTGAGVTKLAEAGAISVWGRCFANGANTAATTDLSTSQSGTYLQSFVTGQVDKIHQGHEALTTGTHYQVTEGVAEGTTSSKETVLLGTNSSPFAVQAGNLAVLGFPTQGVYIPGTGTLCSFSGYAVIQ